jgi:hypothetical protein
MLFLGSWNPSQKFQETSEWCLKQRELFLPKVDYYGFVSPKICGSPTPYIWK